MNDPNQSQEAAAAEFTEAQKRGRRRALGLAIGAVVLGVGAYLVLVVVPKRMIASAKSGGTDCREKIRATGQGDAMKCKRAVGFAGLSSENKANAKAVTFENAYRSTVLAADLAAVRDLDAAARDKALREAWTLAGTHDEFFVGPENSASVLGAEALVVEMARTPRKPDVQVGVQSLPDAAFGAALRVGDLAAAASFVPAMTDHGHGPAMQCLTAGTGCEGLAPPPGETWMKLPEPSGTDDELLAKIVDGDGKPVQQPASYVYESRWTLARVAPAFDPAQGEALIAVLGARAKVTPANAEKLIGVAWVLELELARARWLLGDADAARAALAQADAMASEAKVVPAHAYASAALRVALYPPDQALAWLDAAMATASAEAKPVLALNRGLLLAEQGKFDDALAAVAEVKCDDDVCMAAAWVRLAMLHKTGKLKADDTGAAPAAPKEDAEVWCDGVMSSEAQALVVHALAEKSEAALRWQCRYGIGLGDMAALPARLYLLGALAGGKDAEPWLAVQDLHVSLRLEFAARAIAATWRGDAGAAKTFAERAATIVEAAKHAPAWAQFLGL